MRTLKQASGSQQPLGGFGTGNMVSLDGGKRLRLDDKVDFWPGTGAWRVVATGLEGRGATSMFEVLKQEREREGDPVPEPVALESDRRVVCDDCQRPAQLHTGVDVYPHRKDLAGGKFWVCWPCDAWVGCHRDGDEPFGELAKEDLRDARVAAHAAFDPLWKEGRMTKDAAYDWLAMAMGMSRFKCHIGLMDLEQCYRLVKVVDARIDPASEES